MQRLIQSANQLAFDSAHRLRRVRENVAGPLNTVRKLTEWLTIEKHL